MKKRIMTYSKRAIVIFTLITLVIVNILISQVSLRLDLSQGKAYTLSSSTKNIVKKLDNPLTIKFFVSSDLPTRLLPVKSQVLDLLGEYKKASKGKIALKVLDPKKDSKAKEEAQELGIVELQFSEMEKDKYAVTTGYFAIALTSLNNKEALPQINELESLEYDITALIYRLTREDMVKIGVIGQTDTVVMNMETPQVRSSIATLKQLLSQQFVLDDIDVSSDSAKAKISENYKSLLVFDNNQKEYSKQEINAINEYLNNNGKAVFFADGVWIQLETMETAPAKHNLDSIFKDYGLKLNNNLVLSQNAELVNFGNQQMSFFMPYAFWVKTNNFGEGNSYTSNISELTYPWSSSISLLKNENVEKVSLVKTSKSSWVQEKDFVLNPQEIPSPEEKDIKEFVISAQTENKNKGKIALISSSKFVLDEYLSRSADNIDFVLNILNDFASGGALSGIRARSVSFYPLPEMQERNKDIFKYANIICLPGLFAIYGLFRLVKRGKKKS